MDGKFEQKYKHWPNAQLDFLEYVLVHSFLAPMTKLPKLDGLWTKNLFLTVLEAGEFKVKTPTEWGEGTGRDDECIVINVQGNSHWNCHYESPRIMEIS
jgi:hypothetical protein